MIEDKLLCLKSKVLIHVTCTNLDDIMLNEISHTQKVTCTDCTDQVYSIGTESRFLAELGFLLE